MPSVRPELAGPDGAIHSSSCECRGTVRSRNASVGSSRDESSTCATGAIGRIAQFWRSITPRASLGKAAGHGPGRVFGTHRAVGEADVVAVDDHLHERHLVGETQRAVHLKRAGSDVLERGGHRDLHRRPRRSSSMGEGEVTNRKRRANPARTTAALTPSGLTTAETKTFGSTMTRSTTTPRDVPRVRH
jgi:hypothetical protein